MARTDADRLSLAVAGATRFTHGPVLRSVRRRSIVRTYDVEPG